MDGDSAGPEPVSADDKAGSQFLRKAIAAADAWLRAHPRSDQSTSDETALEWLRAKWGEEYSIGVCPVRGWWALHRQRTRIITARTADGLALAILADSVGVVLLAVGGTVPRQRVPV